mmetsp:Transcript_39449/g.40194  ORF Transcript_39449/g.40194 Transcript_39449/m.40194 type:complete len:460 (+) Transcript_39449:101-1480(+)
MWSPSLNRKSSTAGIAWVMTVVMVIIIGLVTWNMHRIGKEIDEEIERTKKLKPLSLRDIEPEGIVSSNKDNFIIPICGMKYDLTKLASTIVADNERNVQKVIYPFNSKSKFVMRIPIAGETPMSHLDPRGHDWKQGDIIQGSLSEFNCSQSKHACASCGKYMSHSWTAISSNILQVQYTHGDSFGCPDNMKRHSIVQFVCKRNVLSTQSVIESPTCVYNFVLEGPAYCDLGPPGKEPTDFFVPIAGMAYNLFPIAISTNIPHNQSSLSLSLSSSSVTQSESEREEIERERERKEMMKSSEERERERERGYQEADMFEQQIMTVKAPLTYFAVRVPVAGKPPPAHTDPSGNSWMKGDIIQGGKVSCGVYDPCSWTHLRATNKRGAAIQVSYHNGDVCGESKTSNDAIEGRERRRSVVQFVCAATTSQSVTESPTCVYNFVFSDPMYCILPTRPTKVQHFT